MLPARIAVVLVVFVASCGAESHRQRRGDPCSLTSDCEPPLICSLGSCRTECRESNDCPIGTICILDDRGAGVCQLPEHDTCALSSDCPEPLVCSTGMCTSACASELDCPAGSACDPDLGGCVRTYAGCIYNSDCPEPLVCGIDGLCRPECRASRDCSRGAVCTDGVCTP